MITLRMLGIAAAILVGIPIAFALATHDPSHQQVPGGQVVEMGADFVADVTDITLVDPPRRMDRAVVHDAPEQLVEGHTVFVTWDVPLTPNVTNWTLDIVGFVECYDHVNVSGPYTVGGIPFPNRVHEAHVECHVGQEVFVTPDPFYDSDNTYRMSAPQPTGETIPFTAPTGATGHATEYAYDLVETDWLGETSTRTLYMWSVPVLESWMHTDGRPRSWYCPLPVERLQEMGITSFSARLEGDPRLPQ